MDAKGRKFGKFKLPPIGVEPPKCSYQYGEWPFDPAKDGFANELEFIGFLPYRKSVDVAASPIGIGYEVLDRDAYDFAKTIPIMENSGVKWARVQTGWLKCELQKGVYSFGWLDEIVDGLLAIGIQPWLSVSYGNPLYMPMKNPKQEPFLVPLHFGAEAVRGWKNYCAALAKYYKGRVRHWEIWNEPNAGFWSAVPNPDPAEYVELVRISAREIRKHQPDAKIIGGAISGGGCRSQYISGLAKNNIAKYIDIFTYHPYGQMPEFNIEDRLKYIKDLFANCGKKLEYWQGECGRPSRTFCTDRGFKMTPLNQARYLTRRILTDLRIGFDMTSYFLVADLSNYGAPGQVHGQGVIDSTAEEYKPKPAFFALQSMAYLFDAKTKHVNSQMEVFHPGWREALASVAEYNTIRVGFLRGNIPIYAYYFPENIDIEYGVRRISFAFWKEEGYRLENPILIDPITRKMFRYKNKIRKETGIWCFDPMPLLDYPLFLTDLSLIKGKS